MNVSGLTKLLYKIPDEAAVTAEINPIEGRNNVVLVARHDNIVTIIDLQPQGPTIEALIKDGTLLETT